jgi:NDP-sugar pyrophosphorylase family protein
MKAMIFAAGLGKRLGEITNRIPKALVEIRGKSMLRLAVEYLSFYGFNDIIVNVHHFPELMEKEIAILTKDGFTIQVSDEREQLLETAGGLYKARWFFDNEPFLLYNVDIITDINLSELYRFHKLKDGIATLAVARRDDERVFLTDKHGLVCGWRNKTTEETILIGRSDRNFDEMSFSGIHIVNPEILKYMHGGFYSMTTLYLQLAETHKIYTCRHDDNFWDTIGTPGDLERVTGRLAED